MKNLCLPLYWLLMWLGLFLGGSNSLWAQIKPQRAEVIDARTGERVAGATIEWQADGRKKVTDSKGVFTFFSDSTFKMEQVVISAVGYMADTIILSEKTPPYRFILQPTAQSMNEVVVTGTMRPVQRLESPIAVEVYSPQFFKKNPSPSIFEALQNINGVRPQINCSVCNTGDIHINGLEGPYTMVTIDGMPIVSSLSSVYGLFGIPSQLIERVEVIKGPASGLYGSEAVGGLINIITKSPDKAPLFSANVMSTSWLEHNADLGMRLKGKIASGLIGLNYFNFQRPTDKNGDNFTDVTLQHRISVFNKWSFKRRLNRTASLAGRYFYEDRWGGQMQWNKSFRGGDSVYGESIYTGRWELIGNYQLPVKEKMMFSFSATTHDQNSYYGNTPYMGKQKIAFGQLVWDKELLQEHEFLVGLTGRYNYYDDNSTATIDTTSKANKPERFLLPGIFIQDEWSPAQNHTLLFGLRYDHHPVHKSIFTPRIAYKWKPAEKQVVRLNAGTGFRVVNLFTEEHAALTGARAVEIREALKPEQSYNVNINYSRQMGKASKTVNLDVSAWYSYFHNRIIADYETDPQKIIYENLRGYALSTGFSLNLDINLAQRLRGNVGFTFQDVSKVEKKDDGIKEKQRPVLTERWSGTWALTYSFPAAGITLDYTGNVYGPMRLPLISDADPRRLYSEVWSIQNIQLTKWISPKIEIYGGIKNLLNWTPDRNNPFLIARAHDPFDKQVQYDATGNVLQTPDNPYKLTFDPSYIYAPIQGIRMFAGLRFVVR